jgi:uncharacterized membrane protein
MAQMLPREVPGRVSLIYATGILEFAIATGFMLRKFRRLTGWMAAAFLAAVFHSNILPGLSASQKLRCGPLPAGAHSSLALIKYVRVICAPVLTKWKNLFRFVPYCGDAFEKVTLIQRQSSTVNNPHVLAVRALAG